MEIMLNRTKSKYERISECEHDIAWFYSFIHVSIDIRYTIQDVNTLPSMNVCMNE